MRQRRLASLYTTSSVLLKSHAQGFRHEGLSQLVTILQSRSYRSPTEHLPTIARPSFWKSLIPKFMRPGGEEGSDSKRKVKKNDWNPATFYIVIFLVIGSNAINLLAARNDYLLAARKADAKIALLREIIEKVRRGEKVDIERALGTNDEFQEREWKEILEELEQDKAWREESNPEKTSQLGSREHNQMDNCSGQPTDIAPSVPDGKNAHAEVMVDKEFY